jgi:hypothetical protein
MKAHQQRHDRSAGEELVTRMAREDSDEAQSWTNRVFSRFQRWRIWRTKLGVLLAVVLLGLGLVLTGFFTQLGSSAATLGSSEVAATPPLARERARDIWNRTERQRRNASMSTEDLYTWCKAVFADGTEIFNDFENWRLTFPEDIEQYWKGHSPDPDDDSRRKDANGLWITVHYIELAQQRFGELRGLQRLDSAPQGLRR